MSKYLYISGADDYGAMTFEDNFEGDRLELWNKSKEAGKTLEFDDGEMQFYYEALELDDATMVHVFDNMDYDHSKHSNYFKVQE